MSKYSNSKIYKESLFLGTLEYFFRHFKVLDIFRQKFVHF